MLTFVPTFISYIADVSGNSSCMNAEEKKVLIVNSLNK